MSKSLTEAQLRCARDNIPCPRGWPYLGNALEIQDEVPIHGLERLIDLHGPIVRFSAFGLETIAVGSVELLEELSDDSRFWKMPPRSLSQQGSGAKGLFSSQSEDEPDWQTAHRVLMPAFGPLAIEGMFDGMCDIAGQLTLKFARFGSSQRIDVTSDFTRLTLDTIALCTMDFRFNSFYQDRLHPFVQSMNTSLRYASQGSDLSAQLQRRLPWDTSTEEARVANAYMREIGKGLVDERRRNPKSGKDLLNTMMQNTDGKTKHTDSKTGQGMRDDLIIANMVTFLVAGHETTSGLLSFAFCLLLQHPDAYWKVQQEVDRVVGSSVLELKHLKDLEYIAAVLRETLRLHPTAPAFSRGIRSNNSSEMEPLLGGRYAIARRDRVLCLIGKIQRDPAVYGADAEEFKPERMLRDKFAALPKSAWKPFGTGVRSCIGQAFAWQEALICIALLFQNFDFTMEDPGYRLQVHQSLTIKPAGLYMRAALRPHLLRVVGLQSHIAERRSAVSLSNKHNLSRQPDHSGSVHISRTKRKLDILYGSNAGTCYTLARKLSRVAAGLGWGPICIESMDEAIKNHLSDPSSRLCNGGLTAIITPSYEGAPPDNGARFVNWLLHQEVKEDEQDSLPLEGVRFAVFGCGHTGWRDTYQRIPMIVDENMARLGAQRVTTRGATDVARAEIMADFESWMEQALWPAISAADYSPKCEEQVDIAKPELLQIEYEHPHSARDTALLCGEAHRARVLVARSLTLPEKRCTYPEKRHLELGLPAGVRYNTGDYLTLLPSQPTGLVRQVFKRFGLLEGSRIIIHSHEDSHSFLPTECSVSIWEILSDYVELGAPASKEDIEACIATLTEDDDLRLELLPQASMLRDQPISLPDLLFRYPGIDISFTAFLSMLQPLRPRFYSISSSALVSPERCTITYNVFPAKKHLDTHSKNDTVGVGVGGGVTGEFLRSLKPGDTISVAVRSGKPGFKPQHDVSSSRLVFFCVGTGLAPFRAFIQERVAGVHRKRDSGQEIGENSSSLAPVLLFIGCRSPTADRLYADEFDEWSEKGYVDLRYAFSQQPESSLGCRHVQNRIWNDRKDIQAAWNAGAKFLICASSKVSAAIGEVATRIIQEGAELRGERISEEQAREWLDERKQDRILVETFA